MQAGSRSRINLRDCVTGRSTCLSLCCCYTRVRGCASALSDDIVNAAPRGVFRSVTVAPETSKCSIRIWRSVERSHCCPPLIACAVLRSNLCVHYSRTNPAAFAESHLKFVQNNNSTDKFGLCSCTHQLQQQQAKPKEHTLLKCQCLSNSMSKNVAAVESLNRVYVCDSRQFSASRSALCYLRNTGFL